MNMRTIKNWRITFMSLVALSFAACSTQKDEPLQPLDDVMMQAFYWDVIAVGRGTWGIAAVIPKCLPTASPPCDLIGATAYRNPVRGAGSFVPVPSIMGYGYHGLG